MNRKSVGINTGKEQRCPLDDPEARLTYKNTEGYADPTCFFALCNVMRGGKGEEARWQAKSGPLKRRAETLSCRRRRSSAAQIP